MRAWTGILGLMAAGCASVPAAPEPACETIPLELVVKGGEVQNTNPEGQSMAVDVRVYALAKKEGFERLDFQTVHDKGGDALGPDLLADSRVTVFPREEQIVAMNVPPKTRYLALVGHFRRAEGDGWAEVLDVQPAVAACKPGGLAGLVRAQIVDNRIQAATNAE